MTSSLQLAGLKEDLKLLERLYLKKHSSKETNRNGTSCGDKPCSSSPPPSCFRIISSNMDEVVCELVDANNKRYRIIANICVLHII